MSGVAHCEQLSHVQMLGEFPCPWRGGNSPRIENGDNCSKHATPLVFSLFIL
jgi:hypothetical protein